MFSQHYMMLALKQASLAAGKQEFPIGAVLVAPDGKILAETHNQNRTLNDPTAHAEILALRQAGAYLQNYRLCDCDLYVTLEPCTMCAGAISHARIRRLYYALEDEKGGAVSNGIRFFNQETCFHAPEIYYPFCETEASGIIQDFMKILRHS